MNALNTFFGLEIARRALQVNQTAIDVTGNNIANANTEGYSRQRVEISASQPYTILAMNKPTAPGQLGTGVKIDQILRLRDAFADSILRGEVTRQGFWDSKGDVLTKIEGIVNESSGSGLGHALREFFAGWQELSKDPSMVNRAVLVEKAKGLLLSLIHI